LELAEQTRRVTEIKHDNVMQELHSMADEQSVRHMEEKVSSTIFFFRGCIFFAAFACCYGVWLNHLDSFFFFTSILLLLLFFGIFYHSF
jgi:hypothetical protein